MGAVIHSVSSSPKSNPITETTKKQSPTQQSSNTGIDYKLIQKMINDAVTKSLKEIFLATVVLPPAVTI
jgi:hypothetical protein